jgi:DNA-binding PucR family transcriptional regulator
MVQENVIDVLFFTDTNGVVIEESKKNPFSFEDYRDTFQALQNDLGLLAKIYVGNFYETNAPIQKYFEEERELFRLGMMSEKSEEAFYFSNTFFSKYFSKAINESAVLNYQKQMLLSFEGIEDLVDTLWKNDGSITHSAKDLFMHRNTLQYKIERVSERCGMNLKKMGDLLLCYLIIHS